MTNRRAIEFLRPVACVLALTATAPAALAQCGYGTSEQDCRHIQRDERAARENERQAHGQWESEETGSEYEAGGSGGAAPDGPIKRIVQAPSFAAVAYAGDSAQAWADWGHRSRAEAEQAALAACRQDAGDECAIQQWQGNGAIVVGTTGPGTQVAMVGDTAADAAARLRSNCDKDGFGPCTVKWTFVAEPWSEIEGEPRPNTVRTYRPPAGAALWNRYCAVAWTTQETAQWSQTVWTSCGDERLKKSKSAALSRCQSESGSTCEIGEWRANGVVAAALSSTRRLVLAGGSDRAAAERAVQSRCRANQLGCTIVGAFESSTAGVRTQAFGSVDPASGRF